MSPRTRRVLVDAGSIDEVGCRADALVTYGPRSRDLGLDRFPLALDGDGHRVARKRIASVLAATADAHRRSLAPARAVAADSLPPKGARVDLAAEVVAPAVAAWAESWFGLPGEGRRLLATSRFVAHAMFFNPTLPFLRADGRGLATARVAIDRERARLRRLLPAAPGDTVAGVLLRAHDGDPDAATDDLLGLTVGPLALGTWAIDLAIVPLVRSSRELDAVVGSAVGARASFHAALAQRQPLKGFFRRVDDRTVLALTATAIRMGNPRSSRLVFGTGTHACMGVDHITDVAEVVLRAVAERRPRSSARRPRLQREHAPAGIRRWPFPGHLVAQVRQ